MHKIWTVLVGLALAVLVAALGAQTRTPQDDAAKRLLGTWRLIETTVDGKPDPSRGLHPTGLLYYDATGHMALQVMPERGRPAFAGTDPTAEEAQAALRGYSAYFGTYTLDEHAHTVTHHREGNINPGGLGDFVRRYEFLPGDRVALRPMESQNELVWERIK